MLIVSFVIVLLLFQVAEDNKRKQARTAAKSAADASEVKGKDDGVIVPDYTITSQYGVDMTDYSQSLSGTPMVCHHSRIGPVYMLVYFLL